MMNEIPELAIWTGWFCFIFPGPLYIHLSYAPRWRILDRLDRGLAPFEGMSRTIDEGSADEVAEADDDELEEVVEASS